MRIELSPGKKAANTMKAVYSAKLMNDTGTVAEIKDAPHDIASRWAYLMKELHDDMPEIKMVGVCLYCGSTDRNGQFCGGCERVFRG